MSVLGQGAVLGIGVRRHQLAGRGVIPFQPRAGQTFQPGSAVVHRIGAALGEVPSARTDLVSLGTFEGLVTFVASSTADAAGGAVDPVSLQPQVITIQPFDRTGYFVSATGADLITYSMIDQPCFWVDDGTLAATDGNGTRSFAGYIDDVVATGPWAGYVVLRSNLEIRALYELYSAGAASSGGISDDTVRAVATSFPAGTFATGVLTLTATGAFSTAQDGVTLAVGDKFILPVGTITTLVVSAANAGVYEVTSLGATGTSATFTRSARYGHGAVITRIRLRVGGEGTLFKGSDWSTLPATAGLLVGSGDASLYPDKVIQTVALTASAATITNVPIRSATKSSVHAALAAVGGTTTLTIGYGIVVAPTPGGIGTASTVVNAIASGGTKNGTADTSSLIVTIFN